MSIDTPSNERFLKKDTPETECPSNAVLLERSAPSADNFRDLITHHCTDLLADLLRRGHSVSFRAPGMSMRPTIFDGELITVKPVSALDIRKGDIILYTNGKKLTAHRVVRIEKNGSVLTQSSSLNPHPSLLDTPSSLVTPYPLFITRGDASGTCDEPVQPGQILGKVVSVQRDGCRIGLDTRRSKISHVLRFYASCLKRWIVRSLRSIGDTNAGFLG